MRAFFVKYWGVLFIYRSKQEITTLKYQKNGKKR